MQIDARRRTVQELFGGRQQLRVPAYQRPYAWTSQQIDQFWQDIHDSLGSGHFLGPLVIYKKDNQVREVIDGQQRLTTVQILLALIRDKYVALGADEEAEDPHSLIFGTAYVKGDNRFRFRSGKRNWHVLRDYVLRHPNDPEGKRRKIESKQHRDELPAVEWQKNKALVAAYRRLSEKLEDYIDRSSSPMAALDQLEDTLVFHVDVVSIEVEGLADAFLLFETLNDRGLSLSAADLLKSHLLSRLDEKTQTDDAVQAASDEWDDLVELLGGGDITRYLRHFLLMSRKKVRKSEIFTEFQQEVRDLGAEKLLEELRVMGGRYAEFTKPDIAENDDVKHVLHDLRGINAVTHYIALLPARRWLSNADFVDFARLTEVLSFRWIVAGLNAQDLENIYQEASSILYKSKGAQAQEARAVLEENIPSNQLFMEQFRHQRLGTTYVARYMLRRIENARHPIGEFEFKPNTSVHVEHIMPRGKTEHWSSKLRSDQDYGSLVERWGNLTLLHSKPNQKIQNGPWDDPADADKSPSDRISKRPHFAESEVILTNELAALEDWTPALIDLRQQWLAVAANEIWSVKALRGSGLNIPSLSTTLERPADFGIEMEDIEDAGDESTSDTV